MKRNSIIFGALALLLPMVASMQSVTVGQERITLSKGAVFEMIVASPDLESTTTWTLVEEDTFVSSERGTYFQNRFTEAGSFELRIEYASNGEQRIRNVNFTINDRDPEEVPTGFDVGLDTVPPAKAGSILLSPRRRIIELKPQPGVNSVTFDFLSNVDTNGDGNPSNDNDIEETLLASGKAPLYVWFPDDFSKKTISYTLNDRENEYLSLVSLVSSNPDNKPVSPPVATNPPASNTGSTATGSTQGSGSSSSAPSSPPPAQNNGGLEIVTREDSDGSWNIKMIIPKGAESTLVPHWDFGDGFQSLEAEPVHQYRKDGIYTITGHVYDIEAGKILRSITTEVTAKAASFSIPPTINSNVNSSVASSVSTTSNSSSSTSSNNTDSEAVNNGDSKESSGLFMMAIWLLIIALVLMLAVWLLRKVWKMFKGDDRFQKALNDMEAQLVPDKSTKETVKPEAQAAVAVPQVSLGADPLAKPNTPVSPTPVATPKPTAPTPNPVKPVVSSSPPTPAAKEPLQPKPEALKADAAKAPDWLSAGLTTDTKKTESPAQTPIKPTAPTTPKPNAPVPAPVKPVPTPAKAEIKKEESKKEVPGTEKTSSTPSSSSTSSTSKDVPDWLKPTGDKPTEAPKNEALKPTVPTPAAVKPESKKEIPKKEGVLGDMFSTPTAPAPINNRDKTTTPTPKPAAPAPAPVKPTMSEVKKEAPKAATPAPADVKTEKTSTTSKTSSTSEASNSVPDWLKPTEDKPKEAPRAVAATPPKAAEPLVKKEEIKPVTPTPTPIKPAAPEIKKEVPKPATPAPIPAKSVEPKKEVVKPAKTKTATSTPATDLPDWLKPKEEPNVQTAKTGPVKPEIKKEEPKKEVPMTEKSSSTPSSSTSSTPKDVPDWLKPAEDKLKEAPKTETPKPATPTPAAIKTEIKKEEPKPITPEIKKEEPKKEVPMTEKSSSTSSSSTSSTSKDVPDWLKPATETPPADTERKQKFIELAKENNQEQGNI